MPNTVMQSLTMAVDNPAKLVPQLEAEHGKRSQQLRPDELSRRQ